MLSRSELLSGIERFRKKYVGSKGMHVVLDYTLLHSNAAGGAIKADGKVYINPYSIDDYEDLETILKHEDLGHLLIGSVFNDLNSFVYFCFDVWDTADFKDEYDDLHKYYYQSCVEQGASALEVRIDPDRLKKIIYPSEYIAIWVQRHDYEKHSFFTKLKKSKVEKKLNEYLRKYTFEETHRLDHWEKGGFSERNFTAISA